MPEPLDAARRSKKLAIMNCDTGNASSHTMPTVGGRVQPGCRPVSIRSSHREPSPVSRRAVPSRVYRNASTESRPPVKMKKGAVSAPSLLGRTNGLVRRKLPSSVPGSVGAGAFVCPVLPSLRNLSRNYCSVFQAEERIDVTACRRIKRIARLATEEKRDRK